MTITQKQKELLEKDLKGISVSYVIGLIAASLVSGVAYFLVLKQLSGLPLFGVEEFLTGGWSLLWTFFVFLFVFYEWMKVNKLSDRKREIQMKLAEDVVEAGAQTSAGPNENIIEKPVAAVPPEKTAITGQGSPIKRSDFNRRYEEELKKRESIVVKDDKEEGP